MDEPSRNNERELLRQSWDRLSGETLDTYLVSGVEDPRVNVQSVLNRSLLCDFLMPGRFTQILEGELRTLRQFAAQVDVVSTAELARTKFGFGQYYNPEAYTIIAAK